MKLAFIPFAKREPPTTVELNNNIDELGFLHGAVVVPGAPVVDTVTVEIGASDQL